MSAQRRLGRGPAGPSHREVKPARAPRRLGRRSRIAIPALTLIAALGLGGASQSLAATGIVYFDNGGNAAAGGFLFGSVTSGQHNVGVGFDVMPNVSSASGNVAVGTNALFNVTTGPANTATGDGALSQDTTGDANVATGYSALGSNTTGNANVATGEEALWANTTGHENIASGAGALFRNRTGNYNVASGRDALFANQTGSNNVAAGLNALFHSTGSANVAIGRNAGKDLTTGSDNVDIASAGKAGESGTIRIGAGDTQTATYVSGISTTVLGGAARPVVVKSNGQLGTAPAAPKPLSASDGRRLLDALDQQQRANVRQGREIDRLREQLKRVGG